MEYKRIIYIQASIIGTLLLERLFNKDNTINPWIWAMIIINSSMTSFIYITLLKKTWPTILQHMTIWRAIVTVFLFIGGLMSSGTLLHIIFQAHAVVMETDLEHQWNVLFYFAAITRSIHCILGVVFFSLVAPMSSFWAENVDEGIPRQLLALMPSKILLFFHWTVLIPTFSSAVDNYVIHAASFIYRTAGLVWIVCLTIYIIWHAANNVPNVVANEEHGENEVPVQYAMPNVVANEEHGENEVPVQDAMPNVVANEEHGENEVPVQYAMPNVVANEEHGENDYEVPVEESGHYSHELVILNKSYKEQGSYNTAIQQYDQPEQNMTPLIQWFIELS